MGFNSGFKGLINCFCWPAVFSHQVMHNSGGNTNANTHKPFQPHNFSLQSRKCSWQEHYSKTAQVNCTVVGEAYTCTCVYCTQNILHACTYICVGRYRTQCVSYAWLAATYRSRYHSMLMSMSGLVQLCSLLMFRTTAISEICNVNHFCSEPSVRPQHRKNWILCRNRTAPYEWMGRHCTSSMTRHPAATRQSLGTERLWTARPWNDMRTTHTGLLQPNSASVCYWHTMTVAMTVKTSVGEWLNCDQDWWCHVFCPPDMWLEVCFFSTMHC